MATDTAPEPHGRRCSGTSKQTGKPCQLPPIPGGPVCRFHGGKAPQVKAAAERRLQEEAAQAYVARYGHPVHIDWREAIPQGIDETYGNVLALRDLIQRTRPEALTWGETQVVTIGASQFPGIDVTQAAGIVPLVRLYGEERDRLHRQAVDAGKLNVDERRQELAEAQVRQVAELLSATLTVLDGLFQAGRLSSLLPSDPTVLRVLTEQLPAVAEVTA